MNKNVRPLAETVLAIAQSIKRRAGNFGVGQDAHAGFVLAVGSWRSVRVDGGFIITIGLTRDRLRELRDDCDHLLAETS